MRLMLLIALGLPSTSAWAQGAEDLVTMRKSYGLAAVVSVVQASTAGDVSISQAHSRLKNLGLERLKVPIAVDEALVPHLNGPKAALGCGWNQGIYCAVPFLQTANMPEWHLTCDAPSGAVLQAHIELEPVPTLHMGDVLSCWREGIEGVRLRSGAAPKVIDPVAVQVAEITGQPADGVLATVSSGAEALSSCPAPPGKGGRVVLTWSIEPAGRAVQVKAHSDFGDESLHDCLTTAIAGLSFPVAPVTSEVVFPIVIHPGPL